MRNLKELASYRFDPSKRFGSPLPVQDSGNGFFLIPFPSSGKCLRVIVTDGHGWDHVSVSLPNRCPTWAEMEYVKRLIFQDDETAMQLHVRPSEHESLHSYCLHLWRPQHANIPLPPAALVGAFGNRN